MASPHQKAASAGTGGGTSELKARRRPPSHAEQARRVAWGHRYGRLAADAIKTAIQRAEAL